MISARQLEAFKAVMETGSISRAADVLSLTQPAVSKLISGLEETVGFQLFRRERQRLIPTAEAGVFLEEVDALFSSFSRLEQLAGDLRMTATGSLNIAALPSAGVNLLPRVMTDFQVERPRASLALRIRSSPKIVEMAISQQCDVGISLLPVDHPAVHSELLVRGRAFAVLPRSHRLAGQDILQAEQLRGENFISLGEDDRSRHLIDEVFDRVGVSRVIVTKTSLSMAACEFVRCGAGISVIDPITAFAATNSDLERIPLEPAVYFDVRLLLPRERRPSQLRESFISYLKQHITDYLPEYAISR